jgi:hypothetical protein
MRRACRVQPQSARVLSAHKSVSLILTRGGGSAPGLMATRIARLRATLFTARPGVSVVLRARSRETEQKLKGFLSPLVKRSSFGDCACLQRTRHRRKKTKSPTTFGWTSSSTKSTTEKCGRPDVRRATSRRPWTTSTSRRGRSRWRGTAAKLNPSPEGSANHRWYLRGNCL